MSRVPLRVTVYVDGFNLYYGALKGTPYRWLDLGALCAKLLPSYSVTHIRYFTAIAKPNMRAGKLSRARAPMSS